ncbi:MAG: PorT family protein [Flavobacteriales bacterium]|nr:MAG: PorT family protein [Flavobacteriales bacterium]
MNRKIIFLCAVCTFTIASLSAQNSGRRDNLEFGFKAGANFSNVWDTRSQDFTADAKTGFAGGVYAGIPIGTIFGIQPEILFSQKGFKGEGRMLGFPYSFSRTTSYIDIPLQIQIKPTDYFTLVAGPQFSYLAHQSDKYSFAGNTTVLEQEFENENIRKNILGFVAGFDFIYRDAVLSTRVGWDLQTNHGDGNSSTPRYKNQWLQLTLGFKI